MSAPTMAQLQAVYDFEGIIPAAVAALLADPAGYALPMATKDTVNQLQKPRPRIEVIFKTGAEENPRRILPVNQMFLNSAWRGTLQFNIITDDADAEKPVTAQYTCALRWLVPYLGNQLNDTALTAHKIQWIREEGTALTIASQEGYWTTAMQFGVQFTVQADALAGLAGS